MMDSRQLSAFREIAKTRSFTRAATKLGYAQSTITAQIKSLEATLRVKVFDRRRGSTRLTPSGERLLPYAERILSLVEEATQAVRGHDRAFGRLSVGSAETITSYRLPELIESFYHRYPDVRLSLRIFREGQGELMQSLVAGEIDLALVSGTSVPVGPCTKYLWEEKVVLVAAPGHELARQATVTVANLRAEPIIITQMGCVYSELLKAHVDERSSTSLEFGTLEAVKEAVASGLGISLLPWVAVARMVRRDELSVIPWQPVTPIKTYASWNAVSADLPILLAFVSLLAGAEKDLSWG